MAKTGQSGLEVLAASLPRKKRRLPPVDSWDPPFCGDIDMKIDADGTWYYQNTPIRRPALVRLFGSILKREGEDYYLVTPVEKVRLNVVDAPFLAVELAVARDSQGRKTLAFRTNIDDWVTAGPGHVLKFVLEAASGGLKPYLHVRRDLWAKVTRALFYELVELGEERDLGGKRVFGVASCGEFFSMADAHALKEFT